MRWPRTDYEGWSANRQNAIKLCVNQVRAIPYPTVDCTGKTVIVTGGNVGLGCEAARHFVRLNASRVILACRSVEKGEAAKADIESSQKRSGVVEVWQVDLTSFQSVKDFCARADEGLERLDIVVENAGVVTPEFETCPDADDNEIMVTVNVISTFLMALLLLPVLRRSALRFNVLPHLLVVSSVGHSWVGEAAIPDPPTAFETLKTPWQMNFRYNMTKLFEVLIARELAKRMSANSSNSGKPDVVLNTMDPGLCNSDLFRDLPMYAMVVLAPILWIFGRSVEMGSRVHLAATTALGIESHGRYVASCEVAPESAFCLSQAGHKRGEQLLDELLAVLEKVSPGISENI